MWNNEESIFVELLNELKIDYEILPVEEFFDLKSIKFGENFKFRVFDQL